MGPKAMRPWGQEQYKYEGKSSAAEGIKAMPRD